MGIAISDETDTIASPMAVIDHTSRKEDAERIARLAKEHRATRIVIGQPGEDPERDRFESRRALRLRTALLEIVDIPIDLWNEDFSTKAARETRIQMGVSRKKRSGHLDDLAAAIILQDYLDARPKAG